MTGEGSAASQKAAYVWGLQCAEIACLYFVWVLFGFEKAIKGLRGGGQPLACQGWMRLFFEDEN